MYEKHPTLIILGAGGHAKVCVEIAQKMGAWDKFIILDDKPDNDYFTINGRLSDFDQYLKSADFFCSIGSTNQFREQVLDQINSLDGNIVTLIDPSAILSDYVTVGRGTVIMPGAIINHSSFIGDGCIINTGATVDHDNQISDNVHISPGVHLAGTVSVGERTWIGIGSAIINNVKVNKDVTVGAGSLVLKDIETSGVYLGNPVQKLDNRQ